MNKKEIAEIRKLLTKDHCRIDRITGCYVNGEKETVMEMREAFLSLPEEEIHKYCAIFKKALSGTIGKNLMTLEFPLAEEAPDGRQAALLSLRDTALEDDAVLRKMYDEIINAWQYAGNYLILFAFGRYDVPGSTSDRLTLDDASDYVYSFVVGCICPVNLSKEGLCYDPDQNTFLNKLRDQMVEMPDAGFLFPAFTDRNTDLHNVLYYTSKPKELHGAFLEGVLGIEPPLTAETQHSTFSALVEETFQRDCDFEVAKEIHEKLGEVIAEAAASDDPEPPVLDEHAVRVILTQCGATDEQMESFAERYEELTGDDEILASNVHAARKFEIVSPDVKVSVAADRTDLVETRILDDGREYLVIPLDGDVEVNGIRIRRKREDTLDT